jgi:two-component system phosphate regulon sensor histidine kinase PhoR
MGTGAPPERDRSPASSLDIARARRRSDFVILAAVGALLPLGLAAAGEASALSAAFAATALIAFAFVLYVGSSDDDGMAIRAVEEEALAQSALIVSVAERRMRATVIEALPDPAMVIDPQGRIECANAAARQRFRAVVNERPLSTAVRRPEVLEAVDDARRSGTPRTFELIERDEPQRFFSCVAAPLGDEGDDGVLIAMHDLTEIRRAGLARADFVANASHELRTPLTSLAGFIETLRGPARSDPEMWDRFLEIMQSQTDRMTRLINDLLSLSRIELDEHNVPETVVDLSLVIAEARDALLPVAAKKKVALLAAVPDGPVHVRGVRDELGQVVQNLVDNAIKYAPPGSDVRLDLSSGLAREAAEAFVGRRWAAAGRMTLAEALPEAALAFAGLRVSDCGEGIDRRHLPRLGERFYRVDPGRGLLRGTGLGLAICKHIVLRHRAGLVVESEPGRGTGFGMVIALSERRNESVDLAVTEP